MEHIDKKIRLFLPKETLEESAFNQVKNMSELPFVHGISVMPDAHMGKGACVGSVIATNGAIIPAAVGVDIGCGMIAVKTSLSEKDLDGKDLDAIRSGIERRIPVSAGKQNSDIVGTMVDRVVSLRVGKKDYYDTIVRNWEHQLGTLGSGNHFIEISLDEIGTVWVVLHSGSRGIGNKLAEKHIKVAQRLMDDMFVQLPDKDLAYLPSGWKEFDEYIYDLHWAQDFARLNREEMMDRVMKELSYTFFGEDGHQGEIEKERINCHHNFTQMENHFGKNMWITRKGAIQMQEGQMGVIPGSMGTRSYIVAGRANPLSYASAPHGAGRRFSRAEARRRFTMEDFERELAGIACRHDDALLDEIPSAYKDIDDVMENSRELVDVVHVLRQLVNVKGD